MIKTNTITISSSPATITIPVESSQDINYIIAGTHAMGGAVAIAAAGTLTNAKLSFYYTATLTSYSTGANYLQFPGGDKLPLEFAAKKCKVECIYNGTAWKTIIIPDFNETGILSSGNILDGTIAAGDLASDAIITIKVLDGNITLPKIATQADQTILGNVSGGAASPIALTATQARTFLDQDVTLTGNVTGTATQTAGTGVTTVSTTIASNVITVAMCTNTVNTDLLLVPISFETTALTAGSCYVAVKAPYGCTVEEYGVSVTNLIEATDDATTTIYNTAGVLMGTSSVTVTKNTKPSTSAAGGSFFNSSSITSNNTIVTGNLFYIRCEKATAGGTGFVNIKVKRT